MLRSLLAASDLTNFPKSGILSFLATDDLTLTDGRVVCCLLGASCLGGPGILPELRFSSENINNVDNLRFGYAHEFKFQNKICV